MRFQTVSLLAVIVLISATFAYLKISSKFECQCFQPGCPVIAARNNTGVESTEMVLFALTPAVWTERRERFTRVFLSQGWTRRQVILFFVIGTRVGSALELENPDLHLVKRERGVDYMFAPCKDNEDEHNNPADTASTACKAYEGYKHAVAKYKAKYVWRIDTDSYLDIRLFLTKMAPTLQKTRLFMGRERVPNTDNWDLVLDRQPRLKELYHLHQFGRYMSGMGFLMSWDVVEFIAGWSIPPHMNWYDDVMIGMWLSFFQIDFVDTETMRDYVMFGTDELQNYVYTRKHTLLVHYMRPKDWDNIDPVTGVLRFYD